MTAKENYRIHKEPFYQAQGNEVVLFEAAYAARLPVMVKGPTGCGKSRFVEYMAWKLGKPLITVAMQRGHDGERWPADDGGADRCHLLSG